MVRRVLPLVVVGLLAACAAQPPAEDAATGAPVADEGGSPTATEEAPTPTPTPQGPAEITLAFAGDVHFENHLRPLLGDSDEVWADRLPTLAAADFAMLNLETALTEGGSPMNKPYTFRASPVALERLAAAGIDAVSLANNHAADYGRQGVEDTLAAIENSPIPVLGFGANEDAAYAPLTVDVGGVNVGVLASMEVWEETYANWSAGPDSPGVAQNIDKERFTRAAREAAQAHDLVVAFQHWGTEGSYCPNERQVETVQQLTDAGVDIIVGTHAHRPQASGWKGDVFVGYGTGNFIWYNSSTESRSSGVLTLTVDAEAARSGDATGSLVTDYEWSPMVISARTGLPEPATQSLPRLESLMSDAIACADLAQSPPS
ncbi:MAG: CapA family protein [Mobilicoccus sp.]|nr:CapA family protein [Mobilicoccus sp.]